MKFTGRYTAATAKALKGSPRLVCQVTEDGTIYVCNGFLLCTCLLYTSDAADE